MKRYRAIKGVLPQTGELAPITKPHTLLRDLVYDAALSEVVPGDFSLGHTTQFARPPVDSRRVHNVTAARRLRAPLVDGWIPERPKEYRVTLGRFEILDFLSDMALGSVSMNTLTKYLRSTRPSFSAFTPLVRDATHHRRDAFALPHETKKWTAYMLGLADIFEWHLEGPDIAIEFGVLGRAGAWEKENLQQCHGDAHQTRSRTGDRDGV